jgi:superfamily I DNA/RNA helicase
MPKPVHRPDPAQDAAVDATEDVIFVAAGPGSGKTHTLTRRARRLLDEEQSTRALLLTFTNKAADEMKARTEVDHDREDDGDRIEGGTFHKFGTGLLKRHAGLLEGENIDPGFSIIDDDHREFIALTVTDADRGAFDLLRQWGSHRLRGGSLDNLHPGSELARFGCAFEAAKRDEGLLDLDDLVVYGSGLLEQHRELAAEYGQGRHLLVDELQDVNARHVAMIRALAPHVKTISLFGDDDQSIMSFMGSRPSDARDLVEELKAEPYKLATYELSTNYRSGRRIVAAANRVIDKATDRPDPREMSPEDAAKDGELVVRGWNDNDEQAVELALEIAGQDPEGVAILVRNRYLADPIVAALRGLGVPVTDWRSSRLFPMGRRLCVILMRVAERATISQYEATWIARLSHRRDTIDERRPDQLLAILKGAPAADALATLRQALTTHDPSPVAVITGLQAVFDAFEPSPDAPDEYDWTTLDQWFANHGNAAFADAPRLLSRLKGEFENDPDLTVANLRKRLRTVQRPTMAGGGVKIGTIQAMKGLEWPAVYLLGLEQGHLPDRRTIRDDDPSDDDNDPGSLEEERRICYVAITRAARRLVVGYIKPTHSGQPQPSMFLDDIRESTLE